MNIPIMYQDDSLLVIHKPAGLVVNRADSVQATTLQDWADEYLNLQAKNRDDVDEASKVFFNRSGIAHRLDKETSGVMLLAKNPDDLTELMRQFKAREIHKNYLALVHGKLEPKQGFIQLPLARNPLNRHQFIVEPFGKLAYTDYQVEAVYGYGKEYLSLVRLSPKTGRTHQIRVHMKHLGHPLVADQVYVSSKRYQADSAWCPRHFLHAAGIEFTHPASGARVYYEASLPADLQNVLNTIQAL